MVTLKQIGYIVSESPDRIESHDYGEAPVHYDTPEKAGEAIQEGYHGEAGTRYVLAVTVSVVAVWDRPWALVREDPDAPVDRVEDLRESDRGYVGDLRRRGAVVDPNQP